MEDTFSTVQKEDELKHVLLSQILTNPYQPRCDFKREELDELAQSILAVGLLHPPLVRPLPASDTYEIISGERRFRAAQLVSLRSIPVYVRRTSCSVSAKAALIENIQRVDLNPVEIAEALRRLMIEFGYTQDYLAQQLGKKRSTIANYMRLLTLPQVILESIRKNFISMGHGKAILSLEQKDRQMFLHELILRDHLNVREAEQAAIRIGEKGEKKPLSYATRDFHLEQLAEKIRERLGTQVCIQAKGKRGRISIDYYGLDDLDRLISIFGIHPDL